MADTAVTALRSVRVGRFAVIDFVAALWGTAWMAENLGFSRTTGLMAAIPLGLVTHALLGVRTPLNTALLGFPK